MLKAGAPDSPLGPQTRGRGSVGRRVECPPSGNENQQACERGLLCAPDTKWAQIWRGGSEILWPCPSQDPSRDPQSRTWWPPPGPGLHREASERGKTFVFLYLKKINEVVTARSRSRGMIQPGPPNLTTSIGLPLPFPGAFSPTQSLFLDSRTFCLSLHPGGKQGGQ